jgi:hypothetical protein
MTNNARALIVGLDRPELDELRRRLDTPLIATSSLPRIKLEDGTLWAERPSARGQFLAVSHVVYHGIFDDDFDFITALALWGGPCLPDGRAMMDCRQRVPCLVRAARISAFAAAPRGFAFGGVELRVGRRGVAKYGERHCGEGKAVVESSWTADVPTLVEPFVDGQPVRVMLIGEQAWQIRLGGETWLKSIHAPDADVMPIDAALLADARRLADGFGLEVAGIDYIIDPAGVPHMLEVNHIPNVDRFPAVRQAYLDYVPRWLRARGCALP